MNITLRHRTTGRAALIVAMIALVLAMLTGCDGRAPSNNPGANVTKPLVSTQL